MKNKQELLERIEIFNKLHKDYKAEINEKVMSSKYDNTFLGVGVGIA